MSPSQSWSECDGSRICDGLALGYPKLETVWGARVLFRAIRVEDGRSSPDRENTHRTTRPPAALPAHCPASGTLHRSEVHSGPRRRRTRQAAWPKCKRRSGLGGRPEAARRALHARRCTSCPSACARRQRRCGCCRSGSPCWRCRPRSTTRSTSRCSVAVPAQPACMRGVEVQVDVGQAELADGVSA